MIIISSLLAIVGYALKSIYYLHIGWIAFLARPYGWMVFFDTVELALFFLIFFIFFEQPAWRSNLLLDTKESKRLIPFEIEIAL